ncbi:hypothetical protein Tco_0026782 [Tanacetum coccineum]
MEYSKQSLKSENILLKETVAQFQKDFSRMEAHCIALELKYQNQSLKSGQHGQISNETSNKAKIEKEIDSVAKLLVENEKLHKEIEHLKQTYKDLYDSIKKIRVQTKDHNDSLIAQINSKTVENADLKAQIQEKVFANVALKNELRKLEGNSMDTNTGLSSNPVSQQPCLPPIRDDWDRLFQPMFDEYFNPLPIAVSPVQEVAALRAEVLADSPESTFIDQDAPSTKSTSQGSSSNVRQLHTLLEHLGRWTKDHPIANVIGDPSRTVSTRKQLETDAMWCYFNAFLTSVEPKNIKQAMTEPSWIDAMQEEIHEFERLEVWELVPCPDNVFLIKLKWICKFKIDESGGVLNNKAQLVAQ